MTITLVQERFNSRSVDSTEQHTPTHDTPTREISTGETIWSLIETQAAAHPKQKAVIDGDTEIAYDRLIERSTAVAHALVNQGIEPGSLVGVCMERSWELPATLVGILRAGCAYVPLDPAYPKERIGYMLEHARVAAVIHGSDPEMATLCQAAPVLMPLDEIQSEIQNVAEKTARETISTAPAAEDLAYVLYTSGSTGRPKGVAVEHRSVVSLTRSMDELLDQDELSGVAAVASICFDASVMEILGTLCLGGTVILAQNALTLLDVSAAERIRTIIMVPSAMRALLAVGPLPGGVRCVVVGAEVLKRSLVDQLHALDPKRRILNVYGPTEDTVYSTTAEIFVGTETITIGQSVPGSRSYILNDALQPVGSGEEGELYLAGDKLARGYLHDEELTVQRFLHMEPTAAIPERRLYKTGDLCRRRENGDIEFLGRRDQQVKIRGRRIELEEIESLLESMDGVDAAAARVVEDDGRQMLVAYVVNQNAVATDGEAARAHLAERLPSYMVPQMVIELDELPRLPNDKLDRKSLPKPEALSRHDSKDDTQAHSLSRRLSRLSPQERYGVLLTTVQGEIASILRLGDGAEVPSDHLLDDLGIDSLTQVELSSRLGALIDQKLPVSAMMERSTPAAVADYLTEVTGSGSVSTTCESQSCRSPATDTLRSFQTQIQSNYPPFLAGKAASWSATDRGKLVRELKELVSRPGDPFCKLVRTGSGHKGVVADVDTDRVREAIIWTTNLYLGLNRDPGVIEEARVALERFGTGMGTSAAASGITDVHVEFEQGFADLVGMEAGCLFPTGYTANVGAVAGLLGKNDVIVMDQLCHASIVDGARLCGATIRTFQHNNPADLEAVLKTEASPYRTILVVIEGVYSMGEGAAPVLEIAQTAKKYNALVLVDEAHSFGFYGPRGGGICAEQGATGQVDFIMTTLSKALGSLGGVVAASREHVALLKSSSRAFIFQASTSPADIAAALAALRRLAEDDSLRERLWDTTAYMRKRFTEAGYDLGTGDGPIVTPHFYDKEELFAIVNGLFERGVHTSAVTYPIVESGRGRLRFICSAAHSRADVDRTVEALQEAEREAKQKLQNRSETSAESADAKMDREGLDRWSQTFVADLQETYLQGKTQQSAVSAPELAVSLVLSDDDKGLTFKVQDGNITLSKDEDAQISDLPSCTLPSCILRLNDVQSVEALGSDDVQGLLDGILQGTCELSGQVEPFIWFMGRLVDRRNALAS